MTDRVTLATAVRPSASVTVTEYGPLAVTVPTAPGCVWLTPDEKA